MSSRAIKDKRMAKRDSASVRKAGNVAWLKEFGDDYPLRLFRSNTPYNGSKEKERIEKRAKAAEKSARSKRRASIRRRNTGSAVVKNIGKK